MERAITKEFKFSITEKARCNHGGEFKVTCENRQFLFRGTDVNRPPQLLLLSLPDGHDGFFLKEPFIKLPFRNEDDSKSFKYEEICIYDLVGLTMKVIGKNNSYKSIRGFTDVIEEEFIVNRSSSRSSSTNDGNSSSSSRTLFSGGKKEGGKGGTSSTSTVSPSSTWTIVDHDALTFKNIEKLSDAGQVLSNINFETLKKMCGPKNSKKEIAVLLYFNLRTCNKSS